MYRIVASFERGFATLRNGSALFIDPHYGSSRLAVFVSSRPDALPTLVAGQQFIALPPPITSLPAATFTDSNGKSVPSSSLEGRVLTLKRIDPAKMTFQVEGSDVRASLARTDPATSIFGLYPLVEDDTIRRLRSEYLGKRVWGYGALSVTGADRAGLTTESLPITGIYRAYGYGRMLEIASYAMSNVNVTSSFVALDPLVVRFGHPADMTPLMGTALAKDTIAYSVISDAWDFERCYSLISMSRAHPEWSASTIDNIRQGHVVIGMTKDMIAWMFGYPSVYGTRQQVQKLDDWPYEQPAPFSYTVHFRNGIVASYEPPGELP